MNAMQRYLLGPVRSRPAWLIRLAVGLIFATQGYLKYADPKMGVLRFTKIGFAHPAFTAHFVGAFELVCGILVLFGLWPRLACIPLLIINLMAICTTKLPEIGRAGQGFWFMVSDARTDFAMLTGLLFLMVAGRGQYVAQDLAAESTESRDRRARAA